MGRLPDFLIVGAMKAGTTSLYSDLSRHPQIFLPEEKEPEALMNDRVKTASGRRDYERLFAEAGAEQICGEASTGYTKLPTYPGVPERASEVLGKDGGGKRDLKLIYLVRHPVERAISHHQYLYQFDLMPADFDSVLHSDPTLLDYSRYGMQLEAWLQHFNRDQILVLPFESYVADRSAAVKTVCQFLGVDPARIRPDDSHVANRTATVRPLRGIWRQLAMNPIYQKGVRPLLPIRGRSKLPWLRRMLAGDPKPPLPPVSNTTRKWMWNVLASDLEQFHRISGIDKGIWEG